MDRIEEVARALCEADGKNSDEPYFPGERELITEGKKQTDRPVQKPRWEAYRTEAHKFIAAYRVMTKARP
jgi:hypothetical protein